VAAIGGTVLVEPVSGSPRYPLLTAADVAAVIDRVTADGGPTNIGLLADLYHLAVNGDDVDAAIAAHTGKPGGVAHVQIADAPGRGAPGTGSLPLNRQLADLEAAGYAGWVGLEYKVPADNPDTVASFDWLPRARRSSAATAV
jgi:hydroxypyruvate isomerase